MALQLWVEFFEDLQYVRGRSQNTVMAYRRDLELYNEFQEQDQKQGKDLNHNQSENQVQTQSLSLSQGQGEPQSQGQNQSQSQSQSQSQNQNQNQNQNQGQIPTRRGLPAFFEFMKSRKLSTRSQARIISSLRTYFRFLESQGIKAPELRELRPPRIKPALPKPITLDEFHKLFQACANEDSNRSARNRITLLLLFGLGCRVSELVNLNLHDFNVTDAWLKVVGKGGKERLIPLSETLLTELKSYLKSFRPHLLKNDSHALLNSHALLINDRGHRPSRVDVWRWLAAWSTRAGFSEPIGPHQFRHGCATALLAGGADLRTIQILLGHSSLQTTQIYTSVATHKLKEEVDKNHPLSGLRTLDDV